MERGRIRLLAEVVGITAVVMSLVFVGVELKNTREMNLAELTFNRNLMEHNRLSATLESEHILMAWAYRWNFGSWDEGKLS